MLGFDSPRPLEMTKLVMSPWEWATIAKEVAELRERWRAASGLRRALMTVEMFPRTEEAFRACRDCAPGVFERIVGVPDPGPICADCQDTVTRIFAGEAPPEAWS